MRVCACVFFGVLKGNNDVEGGCVFGNDCGGFGKI